MHSAEDMFSNIGKLDAQISHLSAFKRQSDGILSLNYVGHSHVVTTTIKLPARSHPAHRDDAIKEIEAGQGSLVYFYTIRHILLRQVEYG